MKSNSSVNGPTTSTRRLVERLSGWRLIAFLVSTSVNLGLLVALSVTPLFLNESRMFLVLAMVTASHCVVLVAIAGFRFPISTKISLSLAHAGACAWALSSVGALAWIRTGAPSIAMLYLLLLVSLIVTLGGVVIARLTGYHTSNRFSVGDLLLLVTVFAVLFPLMLRIAPHSYFVDGAEPARLKAALMASLYCSGTCVVVANLHLNFLSTRRQGLSPSAMLIGWFLFVAMVDWSMCQFNVWVGAWIWFSMIPVWGIRGGGDVDAVEPAGGTHDPIGSATSLQSAKRPSTE